jgi:general secretion pathway protein D
VVSIRGTSVYVTLKNVTLAPTARSPVEAPSVGVRGSARQAGRDVEVSLSLPGLPKIVRTSDEDSATTIELAVGKRNAVSTGPVPAATAVADANSGYEVVRLKYADAAEIAGVLVGGEIVAPSTSFAPIAGVFGLQGQSTFASGAPSVTTPQSPAPIGQFVSPEISIDRRINAVVLHADSARRAQLRALVDQLDVPQRKVMISAQVVEITESAARNLGIDFSPTGALATGTYSVGTNAQPSGQASLSAAIYALATRNQAHLLATPRIVAIDGSTATILTGDAIPIITSVTFPGSGNVVQQQVQYINVGVNLQILPRVGIEGTIRSDIFVEVSSVTGFVQGVPTLSERRTSTATTVEDGQSFVIGGLLQDQEIADVGKVPILGDIPLIGSLFRFSKTSRQKTNLYVVLTPNVIK